METLAATFVSIADTRSHLEELQSNYSQRLASLRDDLNQSLQHCGHPCGNVSLDGLAFSTNFTLVRSSRVQSPPQPLPQPPQPYDPRLSLQIPSVEQQLEVLDGVSDSNITADLEEVSREGKLSPSAPRYRAGCSWCCWGCAARGWLGKSPAKS